MKNISVAVVGAAGRMGRALIRCIRAGAAGEMSLAGAVDLWDCPEIGRDAGLMAGTDEANVKVTSDLAAVAPAADVIVDFSGRHGTAGNAPRCAEWGKPMVIGTTGLDAEQEAAVRAAGRTIPIVWAPNMSLGINLLFAILEQVGGALKGRGYDVEIIERHHRMKKDAPSGTALGLGRAVAKGMDIDLEANAAHGRSGVSDGVRPAAQIGFHAVRGGDFAGDHTVLFAAAGECIEFSHRATSRDTFALGALRAAQWAAGRPAGLYSMRDVLGL